MFNTVKYLLKHEQAGSYDGRARLYQNIFDCSRNLYSKNLNAHYGCVNALEFSNKESLHFASGSDDTRILVWSIENDVLSAATDLCKPTSLKSQHNSNIFTLAWDNENKRIFSGGNDDQVIVHDVQTRAVVDVFLHSDAVFCISVHPEQSEIFASASENGQVCLYDLRLSNSDPIILASSMHRSAYQACCFNPVNSSLIATANVDSGIQLIDLRMQNKVLIKYKVDFSDTQAYNQHKTSEHEQNVTSVQFNDAGTQLCALRCKSTPILYNLTEPKPVCLFDSDTFLNTCTIKSCCFAGDSDQYICSGSDDFGVYVWRIPSDNRRYQNDVHLKLRGHRSIVNQTRFNKTYSILASCGVEKMIKIWTPYRLKNSIGGLFGVKSEYTPDRKLYRNEQLFGLRERGSDTASGNNALDEDEHMLAFFDSLVRRELQGDVEYQENDDDDDDEDESETTSQGSNSGSSENSDDDDGKSNNTKSEIIEFESDNELSDDDAQSTSTAESATSNPVASNKVKISLRDRLRNLRHRRSLNLTENSEFKNVLSFLNVKQDEATDQADQTALTTTDSDEYDSNKFKYFQKFSVNTSISNDIDNETAAAASAPATSTTDQSTTSTVIKNLNEKRKILELGHNDDDGVITVATISTATAMASETNFNFKKAKNIKRNYRANKKEVRQPDDASSSTASSDDEEYKKNKKLKKT